MGVIPAVVGLNPIHPDQFRLVPGRLIQPLPGIDARSKDTSAEMVRMNSSDTRAQEHTVLALPIPPLMSALHDIARRHRTVAPRSTGCGVSLLTVDGRRITSVATDLVSERLNALHDLHPDNPSARAWLHGTAVWADSPQREQWSAEAVGLGVRSVLATTFGTDNRRLGVMTVYSTDTDAFRSVDLGTLATFAADAASQIELFQCSASTGSPYRAAC